MSSDENKKRFNTILIESIHEAIYFGEVVLYFLELDSDLNRNEIVDKPELFEMELKKTVGPWMARIMEKNILQVLCNKIGIKYSEIDGLTFSEAIKEAFKKYNTQR